MIDLEFWKQREIDQVKYISEFRIKLQLSLFQSEKDRLIEMRDSANGVLANIRNEIKQLTKLGN